MTGPEHYREAERLLGLSAKALASDDDQPRLVWSANVHATLALAAAEAMSHIGMNKTEEDAWFKAAGTALDISGQQR